MRVGEPVHAIKFMIKIGDEHLRETTGVLERSVLPALKSSAFGEVLVLARRRQLEKLDSDGPGIKESRILRRLDEEAPPHEAAHEYVLRRLPSQLGGDVPTGFAHAMMLHNLKTKSPAEYQRRREARLAEQRRLSEKLLAEENRLRVAGYQLDCYAIYRSEADMKADTLDLENKKMAVPHSAAFLAEEIDHLLFVKLTGIHHTVVHRALPRERTGSLFAAQTQAPILQSRTEEAEMKIRRPLISVPSSRDGFVGVLALRSRGEGFSGDSAWVPLSLPEHRGDPPRPHYPAGRTFDAIAKVPYEVVTLWRTEADLLAGMEQLDSSVPEALGNSCSSHVERKHELSDPFRERILHTESSELILRA